MSYLKKNKHIPDEERVLITLFQTGSRGVSLPSVEDNQLSPLWCLLLGPYNLSSGLWQMFETSD
jgi:hypothetical protein